MHTSQTDVLPEPLHNRGYVANVVWRRSGQPVSEGVTVLDASSLQTIADIPLRAPYSPTLSADRTKLYVAETTVGRVAVIDTSTQRVLGGLEVPERPVGLALIPGGERLLVTSLGGEGAVARSRPGSVRTIDLVAGTVSPPITVGPVPERITVTPDGLTAYAVGADRALAVVDIEAGKVRGTVPLVGNAFSVVVAPAGDRVFAALPRPNLIAVIDPSACVVEEYIPVGTAPTGMAWAPGGETLVITNRGDGSLQRLDAQSLTVLSTARIGDRPGSIAISPVDGRYWVVYSSDGYVGVIEPSALDAAEPMPPEGYRGLPGEVLVEPAHEVAHLHTGSPASVVL